MDTKKKNLILSIYREYQDVYGPYVRKDGRRIVILYDGVKRTAKQYARVKLEFKLGRKLRKNETVDHKDRNFKNDSFDNLQVLSRKKHGKKDAVRVKVKRMKCAWCGEKFKPTVDQRKNVHENKAGPFCTRSCAGKYGASVQNGGVKMKRNKIKKRYYQRTVK